jgi:Tfp pilus assembly protein PilZ
MEKRVHKRVFRRLDVKFTSGDISRNAITSNISDNGIFVRTRKVLNQGTELDLELTLPSGEVIQLRGRVARAIITPLHNKDNTRNLSKRYSKAFLPVVLFRDSILPFA